MPEKDKPKHHVRTLEEIDNQGRVISTRIEYDLNAMILKYFPELKEEYEKLQASKKKGEVLPFPK